MKFVDFDGQSMLNKVQSDAHVHKRMQCQMHIILGITGPQLVFIHFFISVDLDPALYEQRPLTYGALSKAYSFLTRKKLDQKVVLIVVLEQEKQRATHM